MDLLTYFSNAGWEQHNLVVEAAIRDAFIRFNDAVCFQL